MFPPHNIGLVWGEGDLLMRFTNNLIFLSILALPGLFTYLTYTNIYMVWLTYLLWLGVTLGIFTFLVYLLHYERAKKYNMKLVFPIAIARKYRIAAFVTAFNEDPLIVKSTLMAVKSAVLRYGFGSVFLLDDSTNEKVSSELSAFCEQRGITYTHRVNRRGFKAGAINDALSKIGDRFDLFTVFDADQRPSSVFYDYVVFHFTDPSVALVQVPQYYSERLSYIAKGAYFQQIPFLRIIMRGRNTISAFSLGSGTTFRISAVKQVSYLKENTVTEDIATSVMLHARGWISKYVDFPGIWYGEPPQTASAYLKQQGRWSLGGFQLLPDLLRENLGTASFVDYLSGAAYWLLKGPVTIAYLLAPIAYLLFGVTSLSVNYVLYFLIIVPYIIGGNISFIYMIRKVKDYGGGGYLLHQAVETLEFASVTSAFLKWITRRKFTFVVTPKGTNQKSKKKVFKDGKLLIPHFLVTFGLLSAAYIGVEDMLRHGMATNYALLINMIWIIYFLPLVSTGIVIALGSRGDKGGTPSVLEPVPT